MELSKRGPITQVRLLFDGEGGTEIININDEVAKLEAERDELREFNEAMCRTMIATKLLVD